MFKYVLKRIGYMFLVLFILSILIFMIYNLTRATAPLPMPRLTRSP